MIENRRTEKRMKENVIKINKIKKPYINSSACYCNIILLLSSAIEPQQDDNSFIVYFLQYFIITILSIRFFEQGCVMLYCSLFHLKNILYTKMLIICL